MGFANMYFDWLTPELALDDWRARIERVAEEESRFFAQLPYAKAVAVIGSVGRGEPWPLSDVDLLLITDLPGDTNAQAVVGEVEAERRKRLEDARIPVEVEADLWAALRLTELAEACQEDDDSFLHRMEHWYWRGIVTKSQGARVVKDTSGYLKRFLERSKDLFKSSRFRDSWLGVELGEASDAVQSGTEAIRQQDWQEAAWKLLSLTGNIICGCYAAWSVGPQSLVRCITMFEKVAEAEASQPLASLVTRLARLDEADCSSRLDSLPAAGRHEIDVVYEIRRETESGVSRLSVARDMLHATAQIQRKSPTSGTWDGWEHLDHHGSSVGTQRDAAQQLIGYLHEAKDSLSDCIGGG
jgi:predicted nucleotidyltransferase